jgi:urease accessory protein
MVDLPRTTSLEPGDALELSDGSLLEITAAEEDQAEISTGADRHNLLRLVWHIGNRHTPCQIEATRCLIRRDAVLENMLRGLGATVSAVSEAFHPEGGAYGQGRTLGHSHETGGALDSMHDHHHWAVHHHGSHGRPDGDDSPETEP